LYLCRSGSVGDEDAISDEDRSEEATPLPEINWPRPDLR